MTSSRGITDECGRTEEDSHLPLITGLPDDIALHCLARVPSRYHHVMRCVSRRWNALLCGEEWASCRKKNNLEETLIYALCRDTTTGRNCLYVLYPEAKRCWKLHRDIPTEFSEKKGLILLVALGKKLYLLGDCIDKEYYCYDPSATDKFHCYDPSANKWEEGAPMRARCYFLSAVLDEKLYLLGGNGMRIADHQSLDVYDSRLNSWSSSKIQLPFYDIVKVIPLDGKIHTIHRIWNYPYAGVCDLSCCRWNKTNSDLASCCGPSVVIDGTLYMLDETSGTRLMFWQKSSEEWVALGRLSHQLTQPPCQLVAVGRKIFIVGKGLHTVVVDIDTAAKVEGMLVSSSFFSKSNSHLSLIGCTSITI